MKIKINKNSIYIFLFFTLFLDAYRFFAIGNRDITLWYVGVGVLLIWTILSPKTIMQSIKNNPYSILVIVYMIINHILLGNDASSFMIGIFCWIFFVCSFRICDRNQFFEILNFYQNGMKIMAVYGIYQIIGNYFGLPFTDLRIAPFQVDGYNWGNDIVISGFVLRRSNAIFREPSYFSQFLAISILIYFQALLDGINENKKARRKKILWIIIMGVALICSFSGTGLLMLGLGGCILFIINEPKKTKRFIKRNRFIIFSTIIFLICIVVFPNPLISYFVSRLQEFNYKNIHSVSGYLRMVLPYQAAIEILSEYNYLLGIGIGNAYGYVINTGFNLGASMQPIFVRTFAEEGIIGGILVILFFIKISSKNKLNYGIFRAVYIGVILMSFMHGTWSSEVFWLFLGLLNVEFCDKKEIVEG